jgi:hypothetical protein
MAPQTRSQLRSTRTPSPQLIERGELRRPARVRVLQLREEGLTAAQIRAKTGIPERTQRRFASTGPRRPGQHRPGRPHKIGDDVLDRIIKGLVGHYRIREQLPGGVRILFTTKMTDLFRCFRNSRFPPRNKFSCALEYHEE